MSDLHETFGGWLVAGARDQLPRDVALHASACPDCLRAVAAFDALAAVDVGDAPEPPAWASGTRPWASRTVLVARTAAGLAAATLIVAAGFVATGGLLGREDPPVTGLRPSPQGEGVLGNAGGPTSPSLTPSDSAAPNEPASVAALPTESARPVPQDIPPMGGGPPPVSTLVPTPTPRPQTLEPTPAPTPVPDDCADAIDNDGDLLIDLEDPGCVLDGNEPSA